MTDPNDNLMGRATEVGNEMLAKMRAAQKTSAGHRRGARRGLLPVDGDRQGQGDARTGRRRGLRAQDARCSAKGYVSFVCGRNGNVFRLMPPLTTPHDYFATAVDTLLIEHSGRAQRSGPAEPGDSTDQAGLRSFQNRGSEGDLGRHTQSRPPSGRLWTARSGPRRTRWPGTDLGHGVGGSGPEVRSPRARQPARLRRRHPGRHVRSSTAAVSRWARRARSPAASRKPTRAARPRARWPTWASKPWPSAAPRPSSA